ncbi:unnamed protein product, partial [Tetraodon nigroviridis]
STDSNSIKVFVRVRPLTHGTGLTTDGDQSLCLTVTSPNTIRLLSKPEPRTFTYDHVADMDTSQDAVFSSVAKNIVESCMNGYNGTIFAYGQTGSGKTFTMLGPSELDNFTDDLRGVIPRSFEYLFFLINREVERSGQSKSFLCKCSFIEIYNEQIYDLLDTASASLFVRENIKKGVFVEGAVETFVNSAAEAYQVLSMGWRNRRVASTSMNRESSRSHAVFSMTLESKESINEVEASSINRSLMCLGQVIMALVDVSNGKNRHICYRDSKLTFFLRDSLGGNAKTYIIANVHPGSRCFGETLSTLHFAQRAKLIKNKAVINEDTQGNVKQLQAEVRKLKEQLAQALASPVNDCGRDAAPGGPSVLMGDPNFVCFQALLQKVAQLEEALTHKDKFIHSSRMIVKFREDHISRLEKKIKEGQFPLSTTDSQMMIEQLREEIKILRDQVEHHPKMTRYVAENFSLRQENHQLRSLESVIKAEEAVAAIAADLDEAFQRAMETERLTESNKNSCFIRSSKSASPHPIAADAELAAANEKLKVQLLQKQSYLAAALQDFEEYKEITKKQISQLESEKRYLEKSNRHLEKIFEATNTYKNQAVSELNRIQVGTPKSLATPTEAYNLRSQLVPLASPEHLNWTEDNGDDIWSEEPPLDMAEMAITEELHQVQEQANNVQTQLNEAELKNSKLLQQISKLEEQISVMSQECSQKEQLLFTERADRKNVQLSLQDTISQLQQNLQSEQQAAEVLRSEIRDLRLVLQSSDKELAAVKEELHSAHSEQQNEMSQLSNSLISTQLQLDKVQLEWEQLLEQHRTLQDSFDQVQAEAKFEADQTKQQLQEKQQEADSLKAQLMVVNNSLQTEQDNTSMLISQLRENKESTSNDLHGLIIFTLKESKIVHLEQNLKSNSETMKGLEQKTEQDRVVVVDLINQTRELRCELSQKEQTISHLSGDIADFTAKYNAACLERDEVTKGNSKMQMEICDLKETLERCVASNKIEVEVLQEEVTYATEEVERLTKVLDEQNSLQASQEQTAQKDAEIHKLEQMVPSSPQQNRPMILQSAIVSFSNLRTLLFQTPCTPGSFNRNLNEVLESQERELESRRSSMMSMEIILTELYAERAAKNEEIQRLKMQLSEKEMLRMEIQSLLDQFYTNKNGNKGLSLFTWSSASVGNAMSGVNNILLSFFSVEVDEVLKQSILKELQEEKAEKVCVCLYVNPNFPEVGRDAEQAQESMLAQSQKCVQELTSELRNRCLELRDLSHRIQNEEKLVQEIEVLRKQNVQLSEENGKLVGHKNHKQRIEYLVKLKKENTKLHE